MKQFFLSQMWRGKGFPRAALLAVGLLAIGLAGGPNTAAGAQSGDPPAPQLPCDVTVRIMPLGDSITVGSSGEVPNNQPQNQVGYRKYLWESLQTAGYDVDFVGSQTNGQAYASFDAKHEGHAGYRDDQVALYIYNNDPIIHWLPDNPADIILLHIGTNSLDSSPNDVEAILNEIDEYEANTGTPVTVILARIINRAPPISLTTTFNNNVETMAQQRIANDDDILLVNMETGAGMIYTFWNDPTTPGDMYWNGSNGLHPYHTGYEKMAKVWKHGIDTLFQHCNQWPEITTNPGTPNNSEGENISLDFTATDPEGQGEGSGLTYKAINLPPGLTVNNTDGVISGTIGYDAYTGQPYEVTVTVTDSGQPKMSDSVTFTWIIQNTNRNPNLTKPLDQTSAEASSPSLQLSASDPDGDQLSYSASGLPDGLSVNHSTGLISGTVSNDAASKSPYTVSVTVTDNGLPAPLNSSANFSWTIQDVTSPVITDPGSKSNNEGDLVSFQVIATDEDGDALAYSASGLPPNLAINKDSGLISGLIGLSAAAGSPYSVTLTVLDSGGLSGTLNFQWTVHDITPPVVTNPGPQQDPEGKLVTLQIKANDADGDPLAFSASNLPTGLAIDPTIGLIQGKIACGAAGTYQVTATATDGSLSASQTFAWQVLPSDCVLRVEKVFIPVLLNH